MKPTIGRIVIYRLTQQDADQINRRRTSGSAIADRIKLDKWPLGAQAHIGNWANEGDEFPCIVARVWPHEFGQDIPGINGQVFLDGNDTLWVTSSREQDPQSEGVKGVWHWPERV